MKKLKFILLIVVNICVCVACGAKDEKNTSKDNENNKLQTSETYILDGYVGESGYIISNLVFDYSKLFSNVYEWGEGIKLPIKKLETANAEIGIGGAIRLNDFEIEDIDDYKKSFMNDGFDVVETNTEEEYDFDICKDGLIVSFDFTDDKENSYYEVWVEAGNVIAERKVTLSDARKLIEESKVLSENQEFKKYYIIPIATKSIMEEGFYEFVIITKNKPRKQTGESQSYYMITDGEKINLCEQKLFSTGFPTNAVLYTNENNEKELVVSGINEALINTNGSACRISGYKLVDDVFVNQWSVEHFGNSADSYVIAKYENKELKYYTLRYKEEAIGIYGRRCMWQVDSEIDVNISK